MKFMIKTLIITGMVLLSANCSKNSPTQEPEPGTDTTANVTLHVTTANKSMLMAKVPLMFDKKPNTNFETTLSLNSSKQYQQIDGFGVAITGSTCYNLLKMSADNRKKLLEESFSVEKGMGYSYIRISIGCSDFSLEEYTLCDSPGIENFHFSPYESRDLFPILREILAINPDVKIMASPWTCPRWMKVNNLTDLQPLNSWKAGRLNPAHYQDYATYFVKFIKGMEAEGFAVESITVQNEPLNPGNSASLYMEWDEQRDFIKQALGPKFKENNIKTKIICFDHNFNYDNMASQQGYPMKIYADPDASQYIDGAAYHAYGGSSTELTNAHNAAPDKGLYFTEMSIGTWNYTFDGDLMWTMREIGIGCLNRYCKAVIVWNYMLDDKRGPNRPDGGCTTCFGAVDVDSKDYATLDRKSHYYFIGHMSCALRTGGYRIQTSGYLPAGVYATAAENPDGTYGIVLQNDTDSSVKMTIDDSNNAFTYVLPPKSITSGVWNK